MWNFIYNVSLWWAIRFIGSHWCSSAIGTCPVELLSRLLFYYCRARWGCANIAADHNRSPSSSIFCTGCCNNWPVGCCISSCQVQLSTHIATAWASSRTGRARICSTVIHNNILLTIVNNFIQAVRKNSFFLMDCPVLIFSSFLRLHSKMLKICWSKSTLGKFKLCIQLICIDLMVPLGDGNGLLNPPSESGMFIRRGTIGFCFTGEGILTATGGSASPTKDWKDSRMFVLGKRKVQLQRKK